MNIRGSLFLLFTMLAVSVFSQNNPGYIVEISLKNEAELNKLEDLNVPVLHFTDASLITEIREPELNEVEDINPDFKILDKKQIDDKYYLVSFSNQADINSALEGEHIIYKDEENLIVKNLKNSVSELVSSGIHVIELNGIKRFKNERYVLPSSSFQPNDSTIYQIVSAVNPDSIRYTIQSLQNFQTRFLLASTRDSVAGWIKAQFLRWGYTDVVIDSFDYNGTWQKNVIATLPGIYNPDKINIVGGHHDSYSSGNPMVLAPGADDNASGTSAVLEIARVLMEKNYQPESTIKFITFAAEEYGLYGSEDFALKAFNSGMDIGIMINHDMISHTYSPVNSSTVNINYYSGFEYLRELAKYCTQTYSIINAQNGSPNSSGSDSYSFWQLGFPSVYFEEGDFSPYYHSPADTIGNYNMDYCAEVIKSSCATLLMHMVSPARVKNYKLVDSGSGNSLDLSWSPNSEPDLNGYNIYVGTSSGVYDTVFSTLDTVYVVTGLSEGVTYFVGVSAFDNEGFESIVVERNATPLLLPLPPSEFTALPKWHQVELKWNANNEIDLIGYNIYRSQIEGELGDKQNTDVYADTVYLDNSASNGVYYYYTVKAVDDQLNESENNTTLKSRVVSLDQGVLIVDETADGDGSLMNPTDEQVDNFYNELLLNFQSRQFDLSEEGSINLADLGAFSTVVWHGNDYDLNVFDYKDYLKEYLDYGGNFLYAGYRPGKAFEHVSGNPVTFQQGDFIYDYLKISEAAYKVNVLFIGAGQLETGYNSIYIDSSKTDPADEYHLRHIESITASSNGNNIYSFETLFDTTTVQGSFYGKPVGVEYIGNDYKTVTISFPLYYMKQEQAQGLINNILINKFNEIVSVKTETNSLPEAYSLQQNYPNPFNPATTIKFSIPKEDMVNLVIYDILGGQVKELKNEVMKPGYYEVEFNASAFSSGVYFYRIKAGDFVQTKKMILLK